MSKSLGINGFDGELVYDHFNVVVLVAVNFHSLYQLGHNTVNTYVKITLASHLVEQFPVMTLPVPDERCEDVNPAS